MDKSWITLADRDQAANPLPAIRDLVTHHLHLTETGHPALFAAPITGRFDVIRDHHFHHWPELFLQVSGSCRFDFADGHHDLVPGELLVVGVGAPHAETVRRPQGRFCNVVLMPKPGRLDLHVASWVDGRMRGGHGRRFADGHDGGVAACLQGLDEVLAIGTKATDPRARGLLMAALGAVLAATARPPVAATATPLIRACLHLVHNRFYDPDLGVARLAQDLGCSADHLSTAFRRSQGQTLTDYLAGQRIQAACTWLEHSELTVAAVARACGFRDPAYFSRAFRRRLGHSPRHHRERYGRTASKLRPSPPGVP